MAIKKDVPITCKPTDHSFMHVETTAAHYGNLGGLGQMGGSTPRSFVLYCSKCGVAKRLV